MRVSRWPNRAAICLGALTLPGLCLATPAPLIPVEQFAAGAQMIAPAISPDGTQLAYLSTVAGERYVVVRDMQKNARPRPVLRATSGSYEGAWCRFKTNTRLLCSFKGTEHDFGLTYPASRLVVLDTDGSHFKVLFHSQPWGSSGIEGAQTQDHILHWLPDDPEHVLIQLAEADSVFPGVLT